MTFGESINTCLKQKYADFDGRASRSEYWWFALFQFLIYLVLTLVTGGIINYETGEMNSFGAIVLLLAVLALIVPAIAAAVRRLHDTDKSGWWYLISFIPYVGGIILLVLLALPGTSEPNRFGEVPLS
ncbi:MAG: DUF805 domain-containing protein [Epsilonproteobacteria bacterium]|nr:DUF805 domain-containing protein [Campylobacterota bacterium]